MSDEATMARPDAIMALARAQLSFRARLGHLVLLLVAMAATVALVSLLVTEPALPGRTAWALGALAALNAVWAAYAGWVIAARRTLLANHRVVAGRIALAAALMFTLGSAALGAVAGVAAGYLAAGVGLVLTAAAAALLAGATRRRAALRRRLAELGGDMRAGSAG